MIVDFRNRHNAEERFNSILFLWRAKLEEEKKGGRSVFAKRENPVVFNHAKQLITIYFSQFIAFYQLTGNNIELWIEAEYGIYNAHTCKKAKSLFDSLHIAEWHSPRRSNPPKKLKTYLSGDKNFCTHFKKNWNLLQQWLDRHNMTVDQLEEELNLVPYTIEMQLRHEKYGEFKKWWNNHIIRGELQ